MNAGWASMDMDKDGKSLFVLGGNAMQKMDLSGETLKPINYKAEMKMDRLLNENICSTTYISNNRNVSTTPTCTE